MLLHIHFKQKYNYCSATWVQLIWAFTENIAKTLLHFKKIRIAMADQTGCSFKSEHLSDICKYRIYWWWVGKNHHKEFVYLKINFILSIVIVDVSV